jgi:hypothetical protein
MRTFSNCCKLALLIAFAILFHVSYSQSQSCNCKHSIPADERYVDAAKLKISPGDTICLQAGTKRSLKLLNFQGTPEKPLVFINCGGQVVITNPDYHYGFEILNSKYFKLTGTGHPDYTYGIKIASTAKNITGLNLKDQSSDFEVDHIEIANAGYAGIMSKTDPSCDGTTSRDSFTQRNISFHDNYIHDVQGEGFYIGNSFYVNGQRKKCNGEEIRILPHNIEGVKIYNNIIENTGYDGIQVGCVIKDCEVYNNSITNYGTRKVATQNQGIQVNPGTSGNVYNNLVKNGSGTGIFMNGMGGNLVFNNIIINPGESGIFCDDRATTPGTGFHFINNTLVRPGKDGIRMYSRQSKGNRFSNNIVVAPGEKYVNKFDNVDWQESNNIFTTEISSIGFINAEKQDFRLQATSSAINAGADVSAYGIRIIGKITKTPTGKTFPIGAYESLTIDKKATMP